MTRFTVFALACLLAVPAQAKGPIMIYSEYNRDGSCASLSCHGMRLLRDAFKRGEIREVHLARASECNALNNDMNTDRSVQIPCTWAHNDYYRPY